MLELEVVSTVDSSVEKSLFSIAGSAGSVPLLVGLHTWSADRFNQLESMLPYCRARGWALLLPEFRGPNLTSNARAGQACASREARQDIMDAVDTVIERYPIDTANIFLLGGSGGGHMSLMMAAYAPERWRAVSSWCPITDLAAWHGQNLSYAPHIVACCGDIPGVSEAVDREYMERSPVNYAAEIARANVFVHHGRFDKSVPYTHTYNLVREIEKIDGEKNFFYEIFNGGHDIHYEEAFKWFDGHVNTSVKEAVRITA
ncbi:MAG: DUF2920 family protein [bacterium]|nr:DUF2920 family protein [bacterium]